MAVASDMGLNQRFRRVVEHETSRRSVRVTSGCAYYLEGFIHDGVKKLIADGSACNEQSIKKAESNLANFVKAMIDDASLKGRPELHENNFYAARIALCPIWPFC